MTHGYSSEKSIQILIALLKKHKINQIIISPGSTNVTFAGSVQNDPFFKVFSCIDERSAAYMACGMAYETGEPVCISCTGATSSRNYMPGLTEAFYRKLPVIAITSSQPIGRVGQLVPQVTDRSVQPNDLVKLSVTLPIIHSGEEEWECEIKVNNALLECRRNGGGPVHINLQTEYSKDFSVINLPNVRKITRYTFMDDLPTLSNLKIGIYVGSHKRMSSRLENAIDAFCEVYDSVVFCDHTSGYHGKYKVLYEIVSFQEQLVNKQIPDVMIHIGEMSGAYGGTWRAKEIWRVNEDGELRDGYKLLTKIFEMPEEYFFEQYVKKENSSPKNDSLKLEYYTACYNRARRLRNMKVDLPFSLFWIAKQTSMLIPENSVIHFAILNSLRAWNFFELPENVDSICNVGAFGIDGCLSTMIGSALINPGKIHFLVTGDLAFFYDMNALGNRDIGGNVRILLINNGKGTQFTAYNSMAQIVFGEDTDRYIAAAGHYGDKSTDLVRHFASDLNFAYRSAKSKEEYISNLEWFLEPEIGEKSKLYEVFTDAEKESDALKIMLNLEVDKEAALKNKVASVVKGLVGETAFENISNMRHKL